MNDTQIAKHTPGKLSDIEKQVHEDIKAGVYFPHGTTPLGGTNYVLPLRAQGDAVVCKFQDGGREVVVPIETYRTIRAHPLKKIGMWAFTDADDPAISRKRYAHQYPEAAGGALFRAEKELEDLRNTHDELERIRGENYCDLLDQMREAWGITARQRIGWCEIEAFVGSRMAHTPTTRLRAELTRETERHDKLVKALRAVIEDEEAWGADSLPIVKAALAEVPNDHA